MIYPYTDHDGQQKWYTGLCRCFDTWAGMCVYVKLYGPNKDAVTSSYRKVI